MSYSDALTHARRVDFSAAMAPGSAEQVIYRPGDIDSFSLIAGYRYSGQVLQLRCSSNRFSRLDFWLQSSTGRRITLAQNVQANGFQSLLGDLIQAGLYLGGGAYLGCSLPDGPLGQGAILEFYGFAEERGNTRPAGTLAGGTSWGQIGGALENQSDLVDVLDAQAETTAQRFAELELELDALTSPAGPSNEQPASPVDGQIWREVNPQSQIPLYPWPWRWIDSLGRWVSERSWIQSTLTPNSSGFRTGEFASQLPLGFAQIWIPSVEVRGFLDNGGQTGTWRLEISDRDSSNGTVSWLTLLTQGQPHNQLWSTILPANSLRAHPRLGYGFKISPLVSGGSAQFHVNFPAHVVRPNL